MDGLVFSDHTPTPGLIEYKKAIEPVQVLEGTSEKVKIINRYDHVTLDHLKCEWFLVGDGFRKSGGEVQIPQGMECARRIRRTMLTTIGIEPGATADLNIEGVSDLPEGETYLEVVFSLRESTNWAEAGHEIAVSQVQLVKAAKLEVLKAAGSPTVPKYKQVTRQLLEITGPNDTLWQFNIVHGTLVSWKRSGNELIHTPPVLDFHRALTDNDAGCHFGKNWTEKRLSETKPHVRSVTWSASPSSLTITVCARIAPPVFDYSIATTLTYTFTSQHLALRVAGTPQGANLPDTFARIGLTLALHGIERAAWFGRGPGESYRDKKRAQRFGTHAAPVDSLLTDYEFPQETGNRTDVRWVQFSGARGGVRAAFGDLEDASFSALHYTAADIQEARHPYELHRKKRAETVVRLDWAHHGLGTGSCGPATLEEYELRSGPFEYEILLA